MKNAIVVLPYSETNRLFHASVTKQEEAFIGENNATVYYQSQAKKFSLAESHEIVSNHTNRQSFVRNI